MVTKQAAATLTMSFTFFIIWTVHWLFFNLLYDGILNICIKYKCSVIYNYFQENLVWERERERGIHFYINFIICLTTSVH